MTNGDKLRQMTDEELARLIADEEPYCGFLCERVGCNCYTCIYEWLIKESVE